MLVDAAQVASNCGALLSDVESAVVVPRHASSSAMVPSVASSVVPSVVRVPSVVESPAVVASVVGLALKQLLSGSVGRVNSSELG